MQLEAYSPMRWIPACRTVLDSESLERSTWLPRFHSCFFFQKMSWIQPQQATSSLLYLEALVASPPVTRFNILLSISKSLSSKNLLLDQSYFSCHFNTNLIFFIIDPTVSLFHSLLTANLSQLSCFWCAGNWNRKQAVVSDLYVRGIIWI